MSKLIRTTIAVASIVTAYALLGWFDTFRLTVGGAAVAACLATTLFGQRKPSSSRIPQKRMVRGDESPPTERPAPKADHWHDAWVGLVAGLFLVALLFAVFQVAIRIPWVSEAYFDSDRPQLELKLDTLEQAQNWLPAADLILDRLQRQLSAGWKAELKSRHFNDLIAAGKAASGDGAKQLFARALAFAQENRLNPALAEAEIRRLELEQTIARQGDQVGRLSASQSRLHDMEQQLHSVQSKGRDFAMQQVQSQIAILLAWGDSISDDLTKRLECYMAALKLAKEHGLETTRIDASLAELERLVLAARPIALPPGSTVQVTGASSDLCPSLLAIDLRVRDADGKAIDGLALKDFQATASGNLLKPIALDCRKPNATPIQVVVLLDYSQSTTGQPLASAKAGLVEMLRSLQGTAVTKVVGFGTAVTPLTDWTADFSAIGSRLGGLRSQGNTALLKAVQLAVVELQQRPGPRAIVLFTDGRDTIGGPTPGQLAEACKTAGIVVHVVALDTADTDNAMLGELARATGGTMTATAQATELSGHFRGVAQRLSAPFYRLVLLGDTSRQPVELRVGDAQAVTIPMSPDDNTR